MRKKIEYQIVRATEFEYCTARLLSSFTTKFAGSVTSMRPHLQVHEICKVRVSISNVGGEKSRGPEKSISNVGCRAELGVNEGEMVSAMV